MRLCRATGGAVLFLVLTAVGCGGEHQSDRPTVDVKLEDFAVRLPTGTVKAGPIEFRIDNLGPSTHEIIVMRTDLADDALPLLRDGLTVNEESAAVRRVGGREVIKLHATPRLELDLAPGHYVLFCNLEGHYLGKMHAALVVD